MITRKTGTAIATLFGLGHIRPAPGTWGSVAAVLMGLGIYRLGHVWALIIATIAVSLLGLAAVRAATEGDADPDRSEIIIDEVAGQWLTLCFPAMGLWLAGVPVTDFPWPGWVAGFLAFRLFDIWKPGAIGRADRRGDAWGVMADDLIAGLFAGVVVVILAGLWHGLAT